MVLPESLGQIEKYNCTVASMNELLQFDNNGELE